MTHALKPLSSLAAILLLVPGCGEPESSDLTGAYSLDSANSAQWTGGATLTPPAVTGDMHLSQYGFGAEQAKGNARIELTHPASPPGHQTTSWSGRYTNDGTGRLTMSFDDASFEGEYILDGNTLTTVLSGTHSESGPSPVGRFVWKRN